MGAVLFTAGSAPARGAFSQQQRIELAGRTNAMMSAGSYPGMVVGVWAPHDAFVHAYGLAKVTVGGGRPMRVTDRFRIGSITKTMVATVVLRLVEAGKLSLDEALGRFYPGILHASTITLRQLLNHTSLIPDLDRTTPESLLRAPHQRFDPAEVIGAALTQPFCAAWCYSDTNYLLLGQIIRRVTHGSLAAALQRYVFGPARLRHTSFDPGIRLPGRRADGYTIERRQLVNVTGWTTSYSWAAGSGVSTLSDLRRWAAALARGTLLSPRVQTERLQWVPTGSPGFEYGLGVFKAGGFIGHNGLLPGYDCTMLYEPIRRITVVVLGNADPQLFGPRPEREPAPSTLELAGELGTIAAGLQPGPPGGAPGAGARTH